jgi:hypothetical protein
VIGARGRLCYHPNRRTGQMRACIWVHSFEALTNVGLFEFKSPVLPTLNDRCPLAGGHTGQPGHSCDPRCDLRPGIL